LLASTWRFFSAPLSPNLMAGRQPLHGRTTTALLPPYFTAERRPLHSWRFTTAPLSAFLLVVGRPLHPEALTLVLRPQAYLNLQSSRRRLKSIVGVCSRLHAPSGSVPGGMEVDSGDLDDGGSGAGLDRVSLFLSKVLSAKCLGRFVIFLFLTTLYVICTATAEMSTKL
jgi:hypothetical protein